MSTARMSLRLGCWGSAARRPARRMIRYGSDSFCGTGLRRPAARIRPRLASPTTRPLSMRSPRPPPYPASRHQSATPASKYSTNRSPQAPSGVSTGRSQSLTGSSPFHQTSTPPSKPRSKRSPPTTPATAATFACNGKPSPRGREGSIAGGRWFVLQVTRGGFGGIWRGRLWLGSLRSA